MIGEGNSSSDEEEVDSNTVKQSCHCEFSNLRLSGFTVTLTTDQLSSYTFSEDRAKVFITFLPSLMGETLVSFQSYSNL